MMMGANKIMWSCMWIVTTDSNEKLLAQILLKTNNLFAQSFLSPMLSFNSIYTPHSSNILTAQNLLIRPIGV